MPCALAWSVVLLCLFVFLSVWVALFIELDRQLLQFPVAFRNWSKSRRQRVSRCVIYKDGIEEQMCFSEA